MPLMISTHWHHPNPIFYRFCFYREWVKNQLITNTAYTRVDVTAHHWHTRLTPGTLSDIRSRQHTQTKPAFSWFSAQNKNLHERGREQRLRAEIWSNLRQIKMHVFFELKNCLGYIGHHTKSGNGTWCDQQIIKCRAIFFGHKSDQNQLIQPSAN